MTIVSPCGAPVSVSWGELLIMQGCGAQISSILGASCPCEKSYNYLCQPSWCMQSTKLLAWLGGAAGRGKGPPWSPDFMVF